MVRPAPPGPAAQRPKGSDLRQRPERNPRTPLNVTVKWRGGAEAWIEVHTRGCVLRVRGDMPIAELVLRLNSVR
jgi:hypothetical protein